MLNYEFLKSAFISPASSREGSNWSRKSWNFRLHADWIAYQPRNLLGMNVASAATDTVILSTLGSIREGRQVLNCGSGCWGGGWGTLPRAQQAVTHFAASRDQKITREWSGSVTSLLPAMWSPGLTDWQPTGDEDSLRQPFQTRAVPLRNRQLLQLSRHISVGPLAISLLMKTQFAFKNLVPRPVRCYSSLHACIASRHF